MSFLGLGKKKEEIHPLELPKEPKREKLDDNFDLPDFDEQEVNHPDIPERNYEIPEQNQTSHHEEVLKPEELPSFPLENTGDSDAFKHTQEPTEQIMQEVKGSPFIEKQKYELLLRNQSDSANNIQGILRQLTQYVGQLDKEESEIKKLTETMYSVNQDVMKVDEQLFETGELQ